MEEGRAARAGGRIRGYWWEVVRLSPALIPQLTPPRGSEHPGAGQFRTQRGAGSELPKDRDFLQGTQEAVSDPGGPHPSMVGEPQSSEIWVGVRQRWGVRTWEAALSGPTVHLEALAGGTVVQDGAAPCRRQ